MIFKQPPCKDCTTRYIGCHTSCAVWQEWRAEEQAKKAEFNKSRGVERAFQEIHEESKVKYYRRLHSRIVRGQ